MDPGENLGHAAVNYGIVNKKHYAEINSSQSILCRTLGTKAFSHLVERSVFFSVGIQIGETRISLLDPHTMRTVKVLVLICNRLDMQLQPVAYFVKLQVLFEK